MPEATLEASLAAERATAVRSLLRHPLLGVGADPDGFRLVVRHRAWLEAWFESTCGWPLTVDDASGFARLRKRSAFVDERRPLLRSRGTAAPFEMTSSCGMKWSSPCSSFFTPSEATAVK